MTEASQGHAHAGHNLDLYPCGRRSSVLAGWFGVPLSASRNALHKVCIPRSKIQLQCSNTHIPDPIPNMQPRAAIHQDRVIMIIDTLSLEINRHLANGHSQKSPQPFNNNNISHSLRRASDPLPPTKYQLSVMQMQVCRDSPTSTHASCRVVVCHSVVMMVRDSPTRNKQHSVS